MSLTEEKKKIFRKITTDMTKENILGVAILMDYDKDNQSYSFAENISSLYGKDALLNILRNMYDQVKKIDKEMKDGTRK